MLPVGRGAVVLESRLSAMLVFFLCTILFFSLFSFLSSLVFPLMLLLALYSSARFLR